MRKAVAVFGLIVLLLVTISGGFVADASGGVQHVAQEDTNGGDDDGDKSGWLGLLGLLGLAGLLGLRRQRREYDGGGVGTRGGMGTTGGGMGGTTGGGMGTGGTSGSVEDRP